MRTNSAEIAYCQYTTGMMTMELHEVLKQSSKEAQLTQQQIADKLGIDKSTYANYESGRRVPNARKYVELANILNISPYNYGMPLYDLDIFVPFLQYIFLTESIPKAQREKYKDAGVRIGNANWTLPGFLPIPFLDKIIDNNYDDSYIDDYFTQVFLQNNEEEVKKLFESLMKELEPKYVVPLDEARFCYNNEKFNACADLLFPLLEGVVRETNGIDKDVVNVDGIKVRNNGSFNAPTIYARMKSINVFLKNHFASGISPSRVIIKRNSLLHGESFCSGKFDCIRILNCIDSVVSFSAIINGSAKQIAEYREV